jgi:hypothetical protein
MAKLLVPVSVHVGRLKALMADREVPMRRLERLACIERNRVSQAVSRATGQWVALEKDVVTKIAKVLDVPASSFAELPMPDWRVVEQIVTNWKVWGRGDARAEAIAEIVTALAEALEDA